ncbi:GRIP and coiled-coil domain-containing protein 1-like [Haliotis cracherodii]|uniref:GRIP and coiled-coil domain-containing protein 1-like n=1 Tax=Haliotis cracherodii TaxID=6455 RepID=UPI0039EBB5A5
MERPTTSDLQNIVESQKEQIQKYESKLRDVVRAYKGLVKEKEALEASLKVLSVAPRKSVDPSDFTDPLRSGQVAADQAASTSGESQDETTQIHTLSSSLATLTQEKSRLEASFLADKKKMRMEIEDLQNILHLTTEKSQKEQTALQSQLSELRSKIRAHQLERQKEETDHGVMLKELQLLLGQERTAKEQLETQLDTVQSALKEKNNGSQDLELYEKRINLLSEELAAVRKQLKESDNKSNTPSPLLLELQKEMEELKTNYQQQVAEETRRANEAEYQHNVCAQQSEERICSLEANLSEISDIIGNYDKMRVKDQEVITKLKERVSQLDHENTVLATAAVSSLPVEDSHLDPDAIAERIVHLLEQLKAANITLENPINILGLLSGDSEKTDSLHPQCAQYKEELEHVKEEFERYKLRAQSVLKNKNKDSSNKDLEVLKDQIIQLREKLKLGHQEHKEVQEAKDLKISHLSKTLQTDQEQHRQTLATVKSQHAKQIKEMEYELKKQRERTIAMLAEKDGELSALKTFTSHNVDLEYVSEMSEYSDVAMEAGKQKDMDGKDAVKELLAQSHGHQGETLLLHFSQEQARRDVELSSLRKQKRQLEGALRDSEHTSSLRQDKLKEENEKLTEELWKQQRNVTRENANLEYLKNVVYNFLISSDKSGKKQMLKAIMTILQFSPKEKDMVNSNVSL